IYGMSKAGALPARASVVLAKRRTPWLATLAIAGIGAALLPFGGVAVVASISSFGALAAFAAVHLALVVLRVREPERPRPFVVPLAIRNVPVLAVVGIATSVGLITQLDRVAIATGIGLLAVVLALHGLFARSANAGRHPDG